MRLSRPVDELAEHYEIVVVGSGYGGAVAASLASILAYTWHAFRDEGLQRRGA
jgi:hypothetical protein